MADSKNWAEMPSDEENSPHIKETKEESHREETPQNQESSQITMSKTQHRKPQLSSFYHEFRYFI